MPRQTHIIAVYGEFVKKPYYVIVHSRISNSHDRFDQYTASNLTELVLDILRILTAAYPGLMHGVCELDAASKTGSSHRKWRYVAKRAEELSSKKSGRLGLKSHKFENCWINAIVHKAQARKVIELACEAAEIPYSTVRKLSAFK